MCVKCLRKKNKEEKKLETKGIGLSFHHYEDVVSFHYAKGGGMVGVNSKGKLIDPKDTRYDLQRDPHGWRAVGKKVRDTDRYGRPL